MHHQDLECAIVWADFTEAIGLEKSAPLVVVEQTPARGLGRRYSYAPELYRELSWVVRANPRYEKVSRLESAKVQRTYNIASQEAGSVLGDTGYVGKWTGY